MKPVAILASGMVTGIGLTSAATCAAFRAAISGFAETRFVDVTGKWILGSSAALEPSRRGRDRLIDLAATAVTECLLASDLTRSGDIPLLLCVAEPDRPGRLAGLDESLLGDVQVATGRRFHPHSRVFAQGRVGGVHALGFARQLCANGEVYACVIVGVDSFLNAATLAFYEQHHRLLTAKNSDGFIPGEASAAVLVGPSVRRQAELQCQGIGFGREPATLDTEEPLRADGLVQAFRGLALDGGLSLEDTDYRFTGCNGEQYWFKDDRLAILRVLRKLKARYDHVHSADCIGEVGAATAPCMLGLALAAAQKKYAPGTGVLCHVGNDNGDRAALIMKYVDQE